MRKQRRISFYTTIAYITRDQKEVETTFSESVSHNRNQPISHNSEF